MDNVQKKLSQTHTTWTWQPFSSIYTSTLQNYMIKRSEGSDFITKCYFQWVKAWSEESLRRPETRVDHSLDKTDIKGSEEKQISITLFFNWMLKSSLNILYVQKGLNFYGKSSFYLNRTGSRHYHSWVLDLEHKTWYTIKSPTRATDWWDPKIDAGSDCRYTWGHGNAAQPEEVQPSEADKEVEWS